MFPFSFAAPNTNVQGTIRIHFLGCKDPGLRLNCCPSKSAIFLFGTKSASTLFLSRPHLRRIFHLVESLKFTEACLEGNRTSSHIPVSKPGNLQSCRFILGLLLALGRLNSPSIYMKGVCDQGICYLH